MTWAKQNFPEHFQRFLRFSTIFGYFLLKHELYPIWHEDHEKVGFFFTSAQLLLSYEQICKPGVNLKHPLDETNQFFYKSNKWTFFSN